MRPPFAPLGGPDVLVDKMIGNAYDTVRLVAINLAYIKHVQAQLEDIYNVSQELVAVKAVSTNIDDVKALNEISEQVVAVASDLGNVVSVANNIDPIIAVQQALPLLRDLSDNMVEILAVHANLGRLTAIFDALPSLTPAADKTGTIQPLGTPTNIAIAPIAKGKITGITLVVTGTDGDLYFPNDKLSFKVTGTNIVITTAADAPAAIAGGTAKVHITYTA